MRSGGFPRENILQRVNPHRVKVRLGRNTAAVLAGPGEKCSLARSIACHDITKTNTKYRRHVLGARRWRIPDAEARYNLISCKVPYSKVEGQRRRRVVMEAS